jgi:hypothetical protein
MLLDFGHAREQMINLFREARITCAQLFQPFNASMNDRNL